MDFFFLKLRNLPSQIVVQSHSTGKQIKISIFSYLLDIFFSILNLCKMVRKEYHLCYFYDSNYQILSQVIPTPIILIHSIPSVAYMLVFSFIFPCLLLCWDGVIQPFQWVMWSGPLGHQFPATALRRWATCEDVLGSFWTSSLLPRVYQALFCVSYRSPSWAQSPRAWNLC